MPCDRKRETPAGGTATGAARTGMSLLSVLAGVRLAVLTGEKSGRPPPRLTPTRARGRHEPEMNCGFCRLTI
jgi:hypothetical protein